MHISKLTNDSKLAQESCSVGRRQTGTQKERPHEEGALKPRPREEREPVTEDGRQSTQARGRVSPKAYREEVRPLRSSPDTSTGLCGGTVRSQHREQAGTHGPATLLPHAQKRGGSSPPDGWLPEDFSSLALLACCGTSAHTSCTGGRPGGLNLPSPSPSFLPDRAVAGPSLDPSSSCSARRASRP